MEVSLTHTHTQKGCFLQGNKKKRCEQPLLLKQSQYLKESLNQIKTKVN